MVPEGTVVNKGDFVASLDNSALTDKLNQQRLEIDKMTSQLQQVKLDTMLELRALRDEIVNLKYDLKQKSIEKEQSRYESPSEINRVQLEYERTDRALKQKEENYTTKSIQAKTRLQILANEMTQVQNRMNSLLSLAQELRITAPKSGMVIYEKNWNGQKKSIGSQIEMWNNTVASLPDLTQMEVVTFVNEVDIQRVKVGQSVDISLDAAPDKTLKGIVKSVANIGEDRPNSDAKIFEVLIDVTSSDPDLRPAMTTSCRILAEKYRDVVQVPLETVFSDGQYSFVYVRDGNNVYRRQVSVFTTNETSALLDNGISPGEKLFLSQPTDTSKLRLVKMDPSKTIKPVQLIRIDSAVVKVMQEQAEKQRKEAPAPPSGIIFIR